MNDNRSLIEASGSRKRSREGVDSESDCRNALLSSLSDLLQQVTSPDFEELAQQYPDFRRVYRKAQQYAASHRQAIVLDNDCLQLLTQALLHKFWGLKLMVGDYSMQSNNEQAPSSARLFPPVPNRFFYVQWLLGVVLPMTGPSSEYFQCKNLEPLHNNVLDIGTGAYCIYPLLWIATAKMYNSKRVWTAYATDIDHDSVKYACENVVNNGLQNHIHVQHVPPSRAQQEQISNGDNDTAMHDSDGIYSSNDIANSKQCTFGPLLQSMYALPLGIKLDVVMVNPPFYDTSESHNIHSQKLRNGRERTNMTSSEGCYPNGGEVGFVIDMIKDALQLYAYSPSSRPQADAITPPVWLSTMCGKKSSQETILWTLRQIFGYSRVCTTQFGPGHLTRWFVAWQLPNANCHVKDESPLADITCWSFSVDNCSANETTERIMSYIDDSHTSHNLVSLVVSRYEPATPPSSRSYRLRIVPRTADRIWRDDERLPTTIQALLQQIGLVQRKKWLPPCGNFMIDINVESSTDGDTATNVSCKAFAHTGTGAEVVARMRVVLQGEICRTTRAWRRRMQRETRNLGLTTAQAMHTD